jgi:Transposase DDE domain group 1
VKTISTRPALRIKADGKGIASHVGSRLLAELADAVGLTQALSAAMAGLSQRQRRHDPGRVLVDMAVMLADGGTSLSDLCTLRQQSALFGEVASDPTAWRIIDAVDESLLGAIRAARAQARAAAWAAGVRHALDEFAYLTLDFDATLLSAHSEKQQAAPTYKRGFGFHPLGCWLDGTQEALAAILRPGNAGANDSDDHLKVLHLALAQLPVQSKQLDPKGGVAMLARADSAGATHVFLDALREAGIEFSVGFDLTEPVRLAIMQTPQNAWVESIDQDGEVREGAQVAEITAHLDVSSWPSGTRAIARREEPHPGAQFTLFEPDGWRHQVFICDSKDPDICYLEARHRGHARVEDHIRRGKDTGLRNLPFIDFAANAAWVECVLIAQDLLAWTQILALDGPLARAEPKRLRYTLLHSSGRLTRSARQVTLHLSEDWPWTSELATAFERLRHLSI